jgi:hypothetical protein
MKQNRQLRNKIARLYIRGHSLWDIVQELDLDGSTVARELGEIRQEWVAASNCGRNEARARELIKLDRMESEAWLAWERSQKPSTRDKRVEKNGEVVQHETVTQSRDGDPRFLAAAQRAIDRRLAIFGFIAPKPSVAESDGVVTLSTLLDEIEAEKSREAHDATRGKTGG